MKAFWSIMIASVIGASGTFAQPLQRDRSVHTQNRDFPWSDAVRVGDLLFISGLVGDVPGAAKETIAKGGIGPETQQMFKNLKAILERNGASLKDVVSCTVFLADYDERPTVNAEFKRVFGPNNYPARTSLAAKSLGGLRVEMNCIAAIQKKYGEKKMSEDEGKIREVIELYTRGTYEGDGDKLRAAFHEKAVMNGHLGGQLLMADPDPFIAQVEAAPLKDAEADYNSNITHIDVDGKVATVILKETGWPGGMAFTNYLHLIDDGSGWKIISKAFTSK